VIFPAYQRVWRVYNNTSGAFSVTVKVAGQTGFEITQGRRYTIQGNSTDVVKELSDDLTEINALIDDLSGVTDVEGARVNLEVDRPVQTKTTDYTQVATDVNNMIRWTSAGTYDLLAAATAGNDFSVDLMADGGTITIDPDGAELVNGAATVAVSDGDSGTLFCDGTAWYFLIGGGGGGSYKGENGTVSSANVGDIFRVHEQELNTSTTIAATENALCAGPLTVASGITLTVTSGGTLVIA
jgi:hypothetical protein